MLSRVRTKLLDLVKSLLKEGMSLHKISLCIALGIALGIFPVIGSTTVLCAIAALIFRLNLPAIQIVNYAVYPLQIILLAPFYTAGSWLFGNHSWSGIGDDFIELFKADFWGSIARFWDLTLYAIAVWLIVAPFLIFIFYNLLKPVIRRAVASRGVLQ
jgi:uncharacterized protein (DUF2062 family)